MKKHSSGFSLIEIMIALGIMSVVALGMIAIFTQQMKSSNFNDFRAERTQLDLSIVGQFLNDPNNCKCLFAGASDFATPGPSTLTVPTPPTTIGTFHFLIPGSCAGATVPVPLVNSTGVNNLILQSVQLSKITEINPDSYQGDLNLSLGSTTEVLGPKSISLNFHVSVLGTPSAPGHAKFMGCSFSGAGPGSIVYEKTCLQTNGGKGDVASYPMSHGSNLCMPNACNVGDYDAGLAGCEGEGQGKYHSSYMCVRTCVVGGPPPSGSSYSRHCGFYNTSGSAELCSPAPCRPGDTKISSYCHITASGYNGETVGGCVATCRAN